MSARAIVNTIYAISILLYVVVTSALSWLVWHSLGAAAYAVCVAACLLGGVLVGYFMNGWRIRQRV